MDRQIVGFKLKLYLLSNSIKKGFNNGQEKVNILTDIAIIFSY